MHHELAEPYQIIQTATKLQKDFPDDRSLLLTIKQYFSIRRQLLKKLGLIRYARKIVKMAKNNNPIKLIAIQQQPNEKKPHVAKFDIYQIINTESELAKHQPKEAVNFQSIREFYQDLQFLGIIVADISTFCFERKADKYTWAYTADVGVFDVNGRLFKLQFWQYKDGFLSYQPLSITRHKVFVPDYIQTIYNEALAQDIVSYAMAQNLSDNTRELIRTYYVKYAPNMDNSTIAELYENSTTQTVLEFLSNPCEHPFNYVQKINQQ